MSRMRQDRHHSPSCNSPSCNRLLTVFMFELSGDKLNTARSEKSSVFLIYYYCHIYKVLNRLKNPIPDAFLEILPSLERHFPLRNAPSTTKKKKKKWWGLEVGGQGSYCFTTHPTLATDLTTDGHRWISS